MITRSIKKVTKQRTVMTGAIFWFMTLAIGLTACAGRPANELPAATLPSPVTTAVSLMPTATQVIQPTATETQVVPATPSAIPVENIPTAPPAAPMAEASVAMPADANPGSITRQEVAVMFDSVENFKRVVERVDGLTQEEKETLIAYISKEIGLRGEFDEKCTGLLTSEEQAVLNAMDMGNPLYQQANDKLEAAMQNDPACSKVHGDLEALMAQIGPLGIKLKMNLGPLMDR